MKIIHKRHNVCKAEAILLNRLYKVMDMGKFDIEERKIVLDAWATGYFDNHIADIKKSCKSS